MWKSFDKGDLKKNYGDDKISLTNEYQSQAQV